MAKALLTLTPRPVRDLFAIDFFATDWRSMRLYAHIRIEDYNRRLVGDRFATGLRLIGDWLPSTRRHICNQVKPIGDQSTLKPIRDQSPTSRRLVADRSQRNLSRRLVADQSLTSRRLVGDHLATYATSSRSNSVAASLLCMFKRQLATDFNRRLVSDFKKTFPRPLQPLRDFSFFLVANWLQTGCRVGVSTPLALSLHL